MIVAEFREKNNHTIRWLFIKKYKKYCKFLSVCVTEAIILSRPAKMVELLFFIPTHTDLSGCLKASQVCMNSEASGYINSGVFFAGWWLEPDLLLCWGWVLSVGPVRSQRHLCGTVQNQWRCCRSHIISLLPSISLQHLIRLIVHRPLADNRHCAYLCSFILQSCSQNVFASVSDRPVRQEMNSLRGCRVKISPQPLSK